MAIPNWKLHSIIECMGVPVVAEESCIGSRYFTDPVEPKGDSMESLMEALVNKYSKISCACFTPNAERVTKAVDMAKEFNASGVVYNVLEIDLQHQGHQGGEGPQGRRGPNAEDRNRLRL